MIDFEYNKINPDLIMFCVYHKKYYKRSDNHYFTFYGVNEIYEKEKTPNNILEFQLQKYNPFLQKRGYMETSAYLHIYWNKLYVGKKMVGVSQYDMHHNNVYNNLDNDTLYLLIQNNDDLIVENGKWQQNMFSEKRNLDFLIKSYNRHFHTTYSVYDLEKMPLGLWQTGIYPVKIFEKLCRWLEVLVDEVYPWAVQAPYEEHWGAMSGFAERAISIFSAYEIVGGISYKGLSITHDVGAEVKEHYGTSILNDYDIDKHCLVHPITEGNAGMIRQFKFYVYDIEYTLPYEKELLNFFKDCPERTTDGCEADLFITCFSDETNYDGGVQSEERFKIDYKKIHNAIQKLPFFNMGKHVTFFNNYTGDTSANLVNIPFRKRSLPDSPEFTLIAPSLTANIVDQVLHKCYFFSFVIDNCDSQRDLINFAAGTDKSVMVQSSLPSDDITYVTSHSTFTLIDCSHHLWVYRLTDAINYGTIPVIVTDECSHPLPSSLYLDYTDFSIVVPRFNLKVLRLRLMNMTEKEVKRKKQAITLVKKRFFSSRTSQLTLLKRYLRASYSHIRSQDSVNNEMTIIKSNHTGARGIVREFKNQITRLYYVNKFGVKSKELMLICDTPPSSYTKRYNILHENMENYTFFTKKTGEADVLSIYTLSNDQVIDDNDNCAYDMDLACFSYSNNSAVFDISFPLMDAYCKRHRYGFTSFHENLEDKYKPHWNKLHYILHMINTSSAKYLVWLDHDIIIKNFDVRISDIIDRYDFEESNSTFMMSSDPASNYPFNTGVIVMKNNQTLADIVNTFLDMRNTPKDFPLLEKYGGYNFHNNSIQDTRVMLAYFHKNPDKLLSVPHGVLQSFWGQAWYYNMGDFCGHVAGPQGDSLVAKMHKLAHIHEFDIVIPVGPNDINVVSLQVQYTKRNIVGYRNIYLVSHDPDICIKGCITIDERTFPFSLSDVAKYHGKQKRNGWYLQQMLKFYCPLAISDILDRYLVIDTDTFFLKPTTFIENDQCLYNYDVSTDQFPAHGPYFDHMKKMDSRWRRVDNRKSGICHHMLFEKRYVNEIIDHIEKKHNDTFWNVFFKMVDEKDMLDSGASEYEIYFNYITRYHSDKIKLRLLDWCNTSELNLQRKDMTYISYHWYRR